MKKASISNLTMRFFALLMLEALYFCWQPFPRSILLRTLRGDAGLGGLVTNLVFLAIQYMVLKRVFITVPQKGRTFWRDVLGFLLMVAVQLGCDAALIATYHARYTLFPYVCYGCAIGQWLLWACILLMLFPQHRTPMAKKQVLVCVSAIVTALCICMVIERNQAGQTAYLLRKYEETSRTLSVRLMNVRFRQELQSGILGWITACSLCVPITCDGLDKETNDRPRIHFLGKWIVRAVLMLLAVSFLQMMKAMLLPQDTFLTTFPSEYGHKVLREPVDELTFPYWCKEKAVYRLTKDNEMHSVYSTTVCEVTCKDSTGDLPGTHSFVYDGVIRAYGRDNEYLDKYSAAVMAGVDVVWIEDHTMRHVELSDIKAQPENATLIQICQDRIDHGDWNFFEYAGAYLMRYAPEFISPYIERYAAGEFTPQELEQNEGIRPTFVQALAQRLLQETAAEEGNG